MYHKKKKHNQIILSPLDRKSMNFSSDDFIEYLDVTYTPTAEDVIVGRGKVCYNHTGNRRLVHIVKTLLPSYSADESTKKSRSELINGVVDQIRESSPDGGFIRFDADTKRWFRVKERVAREKVSQTFRDALNDRYKSSATSKILKRRQERIFKKNYVVEKDDIPAELFEHRARVDSLLEAAQTRSLPNLVRSLSPPSFTTDGSGMVSFPRARSFSFIDAVSCSEGSPLPRQVSYETSHSSSAMDATPPLSQQISYPVLDPSPLSYHQRSYSEAGLNGLSPPPLCQKSALQRLRALQASRELDRKAEEYMILSSIYKSAF